MLPHKQWNGPKERSTSKRERQKKGHRPKRAIQWFCLEMFSCPLGQWFGINSVDDLSFAFYQLNLHTNQLSLVIWPHSSVTPRWYKNKRKTLQQLVIIHLATAAVTVQAKLKGGGKHQISNFLQKQHAKLIQTTQVPFCKFWTVKFS